MKKRSASDMYQVDFVAALFGAFLLLWLARAKEGVSAEQIDSTVVTMEIVTQLGHLVLPQESQSCADPALLDQTTEPLHACANSASKVWNMPPWGQYPPQTYAQYLHVPVALLYGAVLAQIRVTTKSGARIRFASFGLKEPNKLVALAIAPSRIDEPLSVEIGDYTGANLRVVCGEKQEETCPNGVSSGAYLDSGPGVLITPSDVVIRASDWNASCYSAKSVPVNTVTTLHVGCAS